LTVKDWPNLGGNPTAAEIFGVYIHRPNMSSMPKPQETVRNSQKY
jgi:hypothetical protein